MKVAPLLVAGALVVGCAGGSESPTTTTALIPAVVEPTVRITMVGDVMVGRGIAGVIQQDAGEVFAGVRHLLDSADVVAGNLESPLTTRAHVSSNVNMLEADPAVATDLAAAGFDVMALPNNHSTDAGAAGLIDTIAAVEAAGMMPVGGGANAAAAGEAATLSAGDLTIGILAFDATGVGTTAGANPGVATWDDEGSVEAVRLLRAQVDVVIVSIHGGAEYLPVTDPGMAEIGAKLAAAGADVVWGHGAHVVQPVSLIEGPRPTVLATSLGNFLFDQSGEDRTTGYLLDVMVDPGGVVAYRVGVTEHPHRHIEFVEWLEPIGDAGWVDGSWWSLTRPSLSTASYPLDLDDFRHGDLTIAKEGDINGDGERDVVASFRRPFRTTPFMDTHPEGEWADAAGRSAHLGVYELDTLNEIWVAGSVLLPILNLEVCDQSLAISHNQFNDPTPIAAGAWTWNGFGFDTAPDIPGAGVPMCSDIDGDGQTEPVILR